MPAVDTHGKAALMLCESLLHLLVEEGIIAKTKAIEAIEGVAEVAREDIDDGQTSENGTGVVSLIETITESLAAKDERHLTSSRRAIQAGA
jgi:hypothetical protein